MLGQYCNTANILIISDSSEMTKTVTGTNGDWLSNSPKYRLLVNVTV